MSSLPTIMDDASSGATSPTRSDATDSQSDISGMDLNIRFQEALFRTVETRLEELRGSLADRDAALESNERIRHDLALDLHRVRKHADKTQRMYSEKERAYQAAEHGRKLVEAAREKLENRVKELEREQQRKETRELELRRVLDETKAKLLAVGKLHEVATSELKAQRLVHDQYERDLAERDAKVKQCEERLEMRERELERTAGVVRQRSEELGAQKAEFMALETQYKKLADEFVAMKKSRDQIMEQWESVMRSMEQRDTVLVEKKTALREVKSDLQSVQATRQSLEERNAELEAENKRLKHAQRLHEASSNVHVSKLKAAEAQVAELKKHLEAKDVQVSELTGALEEKMEQTRVLKDKAERAVEGMSLAQGELQHVQEKHETETSVSKMRDAQSEMYEKHMRKTFSSQMARAHAKIDELANENQKQRLQMVHMQQQLDVAQSEVERMDSQMRELEREQDDVVERNVTLEHEVERKKYHVNRLHHTLISQHVPDVERYRHMIAKLEDRLQEKDHEASQQEHRMLEHERMYNREHMENRRLSLLVDQLQAELAKASMVTEHHRAREERMSNEADALTLASTDAALAKRRLNARVAELEHENQELRNRLQNAFHRREEARADSDSSRQGLQATVVELKDERKHLLRAVEERERECGKLRCRAQVLDGKLRATKRKAEALEQQVSQLRGAAHASKRAAGGSQAVKMVKWGKQLEAILAKDISARKAKKEPLRLPPARGAVEADPEYQLRHIKRVAAERLSKIMTLQQKVQQLEEIKADATTERVTPTKPNRPRPADISTNQRRRTPRGKGKSRSGRRATSGRGVLVMASTPKSAQSDIM